VVHGAAQVGRLEQGAVLVEEALVVAQVVRVDLEVVAYVGEAFWAGDGPDGVVVDGEAYGGGGVEDGGGGEEGGGGGLEADAWRDVSTLGGDDCEREMDRPLGSTMAKCEAIRCCRLSRSASAGISTSRAVEGSSPKR
jgi:hypothetical protein